MVSTISSVSESGYGIGILSHIILTGTYQEIAVCVLAIPHLIRGYCQLRKLLCDCGGLIQLLQLLDSEYQGAAVQSLSALCQNCFSLVFKNYLASSQSDSKAKCFYNSDSENYNVEFKLDNNSIVKASRKILSLNSPYFNAMLEGSFIESKTNKIKLGDISTNALITILHHFHGCNVLLCSPLKENDLCLSLEVLTLCDRFMIENLSKTVETELVLNLLPGSVKKIYAHSIKYSCQELSMAVLKYVMVGEMSISERQNCFQDLKSCPSINEVFISDIKQAIMKQFPENKSVTGSKEILVAIDQ